MFAYHESFLRLGATDLGCVGDFLTVEPLWLHHRIVFFSWFATFWNTRAQCTPFGVCDFVVSFRARDSGTVSASSEDWCFRSLPRLWTHQCMEFLLTSSDCCCEDDGRLDRPRRFLSVGSRNERFYRAEKVRFFRIVFFCFFWCVHLEFMFLVYWRLLLVLDSCVLHCSHWFEELEKCGAHWPVSTRRSLRPSFRIRLTMRRIWLPTAIALYIVYFFCDWRRGVRKEKRPFPSWSTFATIFSRILVSSFDEDCRQSIHPEFW